MTDITTRPLSSSDAAGFRALRFEALRQYPASFATSVSEWTILTIGEMADMLSGHDGSLVLGAFAAGEGGIGRLIGIVGLKRQGKEKYRHKALVWGMYVDPGWQGQGVARSLLEQLIAHAREQVELRQIFLAVTEGNSGVQALYERLGFRVYGVEPKAIDLGDGVYRDEVLMALDLRT